MECLDVMTDPSDPDKVVVVGQRVLSDNSFGIMVSSDAGATWTQPGGDWLQSKISTFYEVWCVDSDVIWAVADFGHVVVSTDGGATFNRTTARPFNGNYLYTAAIHALTDQIAVVAGSASSAFTANDTLVSITTDGGATWTTLNGGNVLINTNGPNPVGYPTGIWISQDEQKIVVGTGYTQQLSTDGGATFSEVAPEIVRSGRHLTWYPSHLNPSDFKHVGGPVHHVIRSLDSGSNWSDIRSGEAITINGAHFYTADRGYYIVNNQTFETTDGGVTGTLSDTVITTDVMNAVWTGPWPPQNEDTPCGTCPEGFTLNLNTGICERIESVEPLCSQTTYTVEEGDKNVNYSVNGAKFYEDATGRPFPLVETGSGIEDNLGNPLQEVASSTSQPLWSNGGGLVDGRLHAVGVWSNAGSSPTNEWIGFTACIEAPEEQVYCIGIAGDNYVRFRVDGQLVFSATTGGFPTFRNWYVIPITLSAGTHNIELEGLNLGSAAAFGAEIYQADTATLAAMTTPAELAAVTIFSSADKIGSTFDLGEDSGCNCPDGYALSTCNGFPECVRIETAEFEPCPCWLARNCDDPTDTVVVRFEDENYSPDLDLTYVFDIDPEKCYTIEEVECQDQDFDGEPDATLVTVLETYVNCVECAGNCYQLTDCETGEQITLQNDTLAPYVGQVIEVQVDVDGELENKCYQVTGVPCPATPQTLAYIFVDCHDTCEDCLPEPPAPEPPLTLKHRTVKPGWNTKGCPPEYVEKVSCKFGEAMYQQMASERYGIEFCCDPDAEKWEVKKELMDLKALIDPEACVRTCCPPCNLQAEINITCEPPRGVIGVISLG